MTQAALDLREQLSRLPEADRAALAKFLLESLDTDVDEDAEEAWDAELRRREIEIRAGRAQGFPAEQVMAELRQKYEKRP